MPVPSQLSTVAVIGNGIIGHGVAQVFAAAGMDVVLIGRRDASLAQALERIRGSLRQFQANGLLEGTGVDEVLARVRTSTLLADAGSAELVVEAVTEDLELKLGIFEQLDTICPPPAVLASSSGQPASRLVDRVRNRQRVIAAHFWYPPQLIPLVEVCAGPETDPEVTTFTCEALRRAGKAPVVIDREVPGFIGNRLQFAMLREAWALWASGAASAEAIDAVVRNSIGRRLAITGPIESADLGGLDTLHAFAESLLPHLDVSPQPAARVTEQVRAGHRGPASGQGVYDWTRRDADTVLSARMNELFRWLKKDREDNG
jgi:3-hydroxybutyryl-CoA dehydrogenase